MAVYRQNIWTKYITFSVFHNPWDRLGFETLLVDYVQMQDDSEPTALELPQMEARVRPDYRELFDAEAIRRASDRFGSDIEKYGYRW